MWNIGRVSLSNSEAKWVKINTLGPEGDAKLVDVERSTAGLHALSLTLMGGLRVMWETRKFMAMSSQFMYSSTMSLMAWGIT